jgi:hypothetical protein
LEKAGFCGPASHHIIRARHNMKKELEEQQKPLFEVWLEAYNNRLVQVAQGTAKTPAQKQGPESGTEPEPSSGVNA